MKKYLTQFCILFLVSYSSMPSYALTFNKYYNERFTYTIDYPAFLVPQRESENHDGRIFKDKNSELTVWGAYYPENLNQAFKDATNDLKQFKIKNIIKKNDYFIINGESNTKIAYFKTIFICNEFINMRLYYPKTDKSQWNSITKIIVKSFKYTGNKC